MDRAVAIANEFLAKAGCDGLTQMQLQKLVYIAHGWCLALTGEPLTADQPEAWDFGPVYRDLYDHTKYFGSGKINRRLTPADDNAVNFFLGTRGESPSPYVASLNESERSIIEHVWGRYGTLTGGRLSAMTHKPNTPWSQTFKNGAGKSRTIDNAVIKSHYEEIAESVRQARD